MMSSHSTDYFELIKKYLPWISSPKLNIKLNTIPLENFLNDPTSIWPKKIKETSDVSDEGTQLVDTQDIKAKTKMLFIYAKYKYKHISHTTLEIPTKINAEIYDEGLTAEENILSLLYMPRGEDQKSFKYIFFSMLINQIKLLTSYKGEFNELDEKKPEEFISNLKKKLTLADDLQKKQVEAFNNQFDEHFKNDAQDANKPIITNALLAKYKSGSAKKIGDLVETYIPPAFYANNIAAIGFLSKKIEKKQKKYLNFPGDKSNSLHIVATILADREENPNDNQTLSFHLISTYLGKPLFEKAIIAFKGDMQAIKKWLIEKSNKNLITADLVKNLTSNLSEINLNKLNLAEIFDKAKLEYRKQSTLLLDRKLNGFFEDKRNSSQNLLVYLANAKGEINAKSSLKYLFCRELLANQNIPNLDNLGAKQLVTLVCAVLHDNLNAEQKNAIKNQTDELSKKLDQNIISLLKEIPSSTKNLILIK